MASQEGSIGQSMGYFWVGAVRGDPKPKEVPQVYPKQLPAPFLCEQEELMEAGECMQPPHRSHSYLERVEGILHLSHLLFHGTAAALDLLFQGVLSMLDP